MVTRARLALLALAAACAPAPAEYQYVTTSLIVPTNATQALELGFDLDGDVNHRPDNQIGAIVSLLDIDIQTPVDQFIADGNLILLHQLATGDIQNAGAASWQVYLGDTNAGPAADETGAPSYDVSVDSPTTALMAGRISDSRLNVGSPYMEIIFRLGPDEPYLDLHPIRAQFEALVDENGCTEGRIGGAISAWEANAQILPAVARAIGVDPDELRMNPLVTNLLAPDVDLLDGEGNLGHDGIDDAISFGLGMTCARAAFQPPN